MDMKDKTVFAVGRHFATSVQKIYKKLGNPHVRAHTDFSDEFLGARNFHALDVGAPYGADVAVKCDVLDKAAAEIGAVTLAVNLGGKLFGANVLPEAFRFACGSAGISLADKRVCVLGEGEVADAVCHAASLEAREVTRTPDPETQVLVNASAGEVAVNLDELQNLCGAVDFTCLPLRTDLITAAKARGIPTVGGWRIAVARAAFHDRLLRNLSHSGAKIITVAGELRRGHTNAVLIGMPGCGKSTVGKIFAHITGRTLYDLDKEIIAVAGKSIPQIFAEEGETAFRDLESEVTKRIAAESGAVIACGGGTVLREENRAALAKNGCIIYIHRPVEKLARGGRPLSAGDGSVERLYAERRAIYEGFAEITVSESETVGQSAGKAITNFMRKDFTIE